MGSNLRCSAICLVVLALLNGPSVGAAAQSNSLPAALSDAEFWRLVSEFSEPDGIYPYENFVSNEAWVQTVIPALKAVTKPGGVYIGVGPEQNFTYVAALQSRIAFVVDIRRQNMLELLMYKALFEMSTNRGDFVARLFSRRRPAGVDDRATAETLFAALELVKPDVDFHRESLQVIKGIFTKHGFRLSTDDLAKIDYVYQVFLRAGPSIDYTYASTIPALGTVPSYKKSMTATDAVGKNWSYLASEENFQYVREMQRKNLIVPLVGDFAGAGALRNVARYLKERGATVTAFYVSNVESYLDTEKVQRFYANAVSLPIDDTSMFIRFVDGNHTPNLLWRKPGGPQSLISPMMDLAKLLAAGRKPGYDEILRTTQDPLVLVPVGGR